MSRVSSLVSGAGFTAAFWVALDKASRARGLTENEIHEAFKDGSPFVERIVELIAETHSKASEVPITLWKREPNPQLGGHCEGRREIVNDILKKQGLRPLTRWELFGRPGLILQLFFSHPEVWTEQLNLVITGSPVKVINGTEGYPSFEWNSQESFRVGKVGWIETVLECHWGINVKDRFPAIPIDVRL